MVSKRTQKLLKSDAEKIVHGMYTVGQNMGIVIDKAKGIYIYDTEGKEYIDLSSQLICVNLGHRRQEITDAITKALNEIDFVTTFFGVTNPYIIEVSEKLAKLTPGDLNHFHFTSGGAEAVDSAVKLARFYWSRKGLAGKYKIISLYASYHGSAGISTNVTGLGRGANQNPFGPVAPGFVHVAPPYSYRCMFGDVPDCCQASLDYLESVIQAEGPESIAAFIAESIMGAAGMIEFPPGWWPKVAELCKKYDILLIVDEIMSGFARTGKMFCCEHWGVKGDMMTMAKGIVNSALPFAALAMSDEVYDVIKDNMLSHGFTYSGHPIAAAASSAALDIYVRDKVVENSARVGDHIKKRLEAEFVPLPSVAYADGRGCFQALELVTDKKSREPISPQTRDKFWQELFQAGIFTRVIGWRGNRLFICPPCVITIEEADKTLDIIKPLVAGLKPE
jgi:adenosylmethionine-8-amino-7-oxononanoate aminotransferase